MVINNPPGWPSIGDQGESEGTGDRAELNLAASSGGHGVSDGSGEFRFLPFSHYCVREQRQK